MPQTWPFCNMLFYFWHFLSYDIAHNEKRLSKNFVTKPQLQRAYLDTAMKDIGHYGKAHCVGWSNQALMIQIITESNIIL